MITIWHNPRCSKSRQAVALLEEKGIEIEIFNYLEEALSPEDIRSVLNKLSLSARDVMRTKEAIYKKLGLKEVNDEKKLIEAMAAYPKLIERPILIDNDRAVMGRPLENVAALIA